MRITAEGLLYEADPRHVELLAKSLGLEDCNPVATPGIKKLFEDEVMDLPIAQEPDVVSQVTTNTKRKVSFDDKESKLIVVTAYSEVYGLHPSKFVFGTSGSIIKFKATDDALTGVDQEEMRARRNNIRHDLVARMDVLRRTLLEGNGWEESTANLVAKACTKQFKQKRLGAKAAKKAEFESKGEALNAMEATRF